MSREICKIVKRHKVQPAKVGFFHPLRTRRQFIHIKKSVKNHIRTIEKVKNGLLMGYPKAGRSIAVTYSLLMSTKRNELELYPLTWLKNVLGRLRYIYIFKL